MRLESLSLWVLFALSFIVSLGIAEMNIFLNLKMGYGYLPLALRFILIFSFLLTTLTFVSYSIFPLFAGYPGDMYGMGLIIIPTVGFIVSVMFSISRLAVQGLLTLKGKGRICLFSLFEDIKLRTIIVFSVGLLLSYFIFLAMKYISN